MSIDIAWTNRIFSQGPSASSVPRSPTVRSRAARCRSSSANVRDRHVAALDRKRRQEAQAGNDEVQDKYGSERDEIRFSREEPLLSRKRGNQGRNVTDLFDNLPMRCNRGHQLGSSSRAEENGADFARAGSGESLVQFGVEDSLQQRGTRCDPDDLADVSKQIRQTRSGCHVCPVDGSDDRDYSAR